MYLTDEQKRMLAGEEGVGVRRAMEVLVAKGEAEGAERMVNIVYAHLMPADTMFFPYGRQGEWSRDLTGVLTEGVTQLKVPATIEPKFLDLKKVAGKIGYSKSMIDEMNRIMNSAAEYYESINAPISLGVGIIENAYRRTALIKLVEADSFLTEEKELLAVAREKTPKLPFEQIDLLIVDEAGKDISGTGMDTKVIGRINNIYEKELTSPRITRIVLRDLSAKTHGNAIEVGLADFITKMVYDKIDMKTTFVNCVTAITPEKGEYLLSAVPIKRPSIMRLPPPDRMWQKRLKWSTSKIPLN